MPRDSQSRRATAGDRIRVDDERPTQQLLQTPRFVVDDQDVRLQALGSVDVDPTNAEDPLRTVDERRRADDDPPSGIEEKQPRGIELVDAHASASQQLADARRITSARQAQAHARATREWV